MPSQSASPTLSPSSKGARAPTPDAPEDENYAVSSLRASASLSSSSLGSSGSPGPVNFVFTLPALSLDGGNWGARYDFRSHSTVQILMQHFSSILITGIHAHGRVPTLLKGDDVFFLRVGVAPRNAELYATHPSGTGNVGLGDTTPHLLDVEIVADSPSVWDWSSDSYGLPHGCQYDLRDIEGRFQYPRFCVYNLSGSSAHKGKVLTKVQLTFSVSCSGQNFGVGII